MGQRTGFALEFVVPADGYAEPPITVAQDVVLQGSNRLHVDASAYAGEGQWITLMTVGGNLTVADWTAFVSELPEGCKARLVTGSTPKKLQIHLGEWPGMSVIVR